jgi:hypothetical protein
VNVARLVGGLDREQLHDLAKVRMNVGQEASGHQQRGDLVLDQVGHHLHDRVFHLVGQLDRGVPRNRHVRVPLGRHGAFVQAPGVLGPHGRFVGQWKIEFGPAGFDERSTGG